MENGGFTLCFIVYAYSLSHVRLFVTPWTLARQAPLSMEFFRREYWSGLPFSSLVDLPKPGIESESLQSPALTGRFFTTAPHRSVCFIDKNFKTQKHWVFDVVVVQLLSRVWLFITPWTIAHQASLSLTISQSLPKFISIESVIPFNHLILYHPLLLLPSIFPSSGVFSNELALCIMWPKY